MRAPEASAEPVGSGVMWAPCEGAPTTPPRECAVIQVPLDYAKPVLGTGDLHIARVKAGNPASSQGTLLVLPGGPPSGGVSFVGYTANLTRTLSPEMLAAYDVVGIEQFGSWNGTPCLSGEPLKQYWEANHLPKTASQIQEIAGLEKAFNQACTSGGNTLVPYMNTARSVRDIEAVRVALGAPQLNLFGLSYGTALGHSYMAQHPGKVRRAVLDSVVDRSVTDPVRDVENNQAYEQSWSRFREWCYANTVCSLHGQDADAVFDTVLAQAKTMGIPTPRNPYGPTGSLNDWELTVAVQALTGAGEATWQWSSILLSEAALGDGSQAALLYDALSGRQPDGSYLGGDGTRRTIACNDSTWSQYFTSPGVVWAWGQFMQSTMPRYGAASVWQGVAQCYKWPLPAVNPPPLNQQVAGPKVLLVSATKDASAPLVWAQRVQHQIAGAKLLQVNGASHLQVAKSRCAKAHATALLLSGVLSPAGAMCNYDPNLIPPQLPPDLGPISGGVTATASGQTNLELLQQFQERKGVYRR